MKEYILRDEKMMHVFFGGSVWRNMAIMDDNFVGDHGKLLETGMETFLIRQVILEITENYWKLEWKLFSSGR